MESGECTSEIGASLDGIDFGEKWVERLGAKLVDGGLVHAGGVVVGDLALPGLKRVGRSRSKLLEDVVQNGAVALRHGGVAVPCSLVRGEGIRSAPASARELVEILTRADVAVERIELDPETIFRRDRLVVGCKACAGKNGNGERDDCGSMEVFQHDRPFGVGMKAEARTV